MATSPISLITISRQFGAGGSELATAIGERLGWPVLDRDLAHRVAERLRLEDQVVQKFDEHTPSFFARVAAMMVTPQPEGFSFPPEDLPSHDAVAEATAQVIREAGGSPPLIVVGHGGSCIFAGRSDVLHLRVNASTRGRCARIVRRMHVTPGEASSMVHRADLDRRAYIQRYFHRDWHDPLLYDLHLNTDRLSIDEAADMITRLVHDRSGHTDMGGSVGNRGSGLGTRSGSHEVGTVDPRIES